MSRGRTSTPRLLPATSSVEADGTRVVTRTTYGRPTRYLIQPAEYQCVALAESLADAFRVVGQEVSGSAQPLHTAVRAFLTHMDNQPRTAGRTLGLSDLRLRHLNTWEIGLLERQRIERTDTAYRYVVHLFALLRRIEEDTPGALDPDIVRRLESTTRLPHIRRPGDPEFPSDEIRAIRGAAHRLVYSALQRQASNPQAGPDSDVVVALHILWSLGTGEPPEVIRGVLIDDIIASTTPEHDQSSTEMNHTERLTHLANLDAVTEYAVTFHKARTGERYQRVFPRSQHAAFRAITATIRLGQYARAEVGTNALWVTRYRGGVERTHWSRPPLPAWIRRYVPQRQISEPLVYRRFRKTVTTREALTDPVGYLRDGRRHTARTFFDHYTNSTVLRAHAGRVLVDAINETFDDAVNGPTLILPDAEALLVAGATTESIDSQTFDALEAGKLETTVAACRDPLTSPHSPKGHPCAVSGAGDCFACPNALILRRHLPAALRLAELTNPARAAKVEVWEERWRAVYEAVTEVVLPVFSAEDIASARPESAAVLLDPTLLNDLGGVE